MADQQNDHDLLIEIKTKLDVVIQSQNQTKMEVAALEAKKCDKEENNKNFNEHKKENDSKFKDFETRLRKLERAYWIGIGMLGILQIILSLNK